MAIGLSNIKSFLTENSSAGEKEFENNLVSVRQRSEGDIGSMSIEDFVKTIEDAVKNELATNEELVNE